MLSFVLKPPESWGKKSLGSIYKYVFYYLFGIEMSLYRRFLSESHILDRANEMTLNGLPLQKSANN